MPLDGAPRAPMHVPRSEVVVVAEFTAEVFQNEFLPDGGTDVHAVVTITCRGAGEAGRSQDGDAGEIVIIDASGSMQGDKIVAAQAAAAAAIEQIIDGTWFAVIAGTDGATRIFPYPNAPTAMVQHGARRPRGGQAGRDPAARRRRHRDGRLAAPGQADLRSHPAGHPTARDPAHRRAQPERAAGGAGLLRRLGPGVPAVRLPRRRASTGTSPSCAGWPRRCSARWTSSPTSG